MLITISARKPWFLAPAVFLAVFFLSACSKRADTAPKPQPPAPFEFLGSWDDKGDGPGKLDRPVSFAADTLGNIFFVDPSAGFVHKFEANGTPLQSFEDPSVRRASGIAVDAGGAIYIPNAQQGTILVFFPDGTFFQSWRTAPQRHFAGALGLALDEEGTLYAPDPATSRVLKFSNRGRLVKSWAAPQKPSSPDERPSWICAEPDDSLFVAYFSTGRIDKFSSDGTLVTSWLAGIAPAASEPSSPANPAPAPETRPASTPASATALGGVSDPHPGAISGLAASGNFVFTMAPSSSRIRVWSTDGQHKLDADLGANLGKISAPQLAVTPHLELVVFDPAAPKVFRFRMHFKEQEPPL